MKTRISKILGVMLSLTMIASMFLFAVPVAASPGNMQWVSESLPSGSSDPPWTSFFLWPNSYIADYVVADATTVYIAVQSAVVSLAGPAGVAERGIFKSTNAGQSWTKLADYPTQAAQEPRLVAVAPDNTACIAIVDAVNGIMVSNDSGTTWSTLPAIAGALTVTDIAVGPARSGTLLGREYAVALADNALAAVALGDVQIIGGNATWATVGGAIAAAYDFTSVQFTPNFLGDRCVVAVGTKVGASGVATTELVIVNTATSTLVRNTLLRSAVTSTTRNFESPAGVTASAILTSDIALPTNFDPTTAGGRRAYVSIASFAPATDNDVYRIDDDTARALGAVSGAPLMSIAYSGTIDAGTLLTGQFNSTNVKFTSAPTTTSPTWTSATKAPNAVAAVANPMTRVRVATDFATTNRVFASTTGTAIGQNTEFAISNDGGVSFNGEGFINSISLGAVSTVGNPAKKVGDIIGIALSPDGKTIYMATKDGVNISLWKNTTPISSSGWSRILFVPAVTSAVLTINPDYATTPCVFLAITSAAGANIYVSSNAGTTFSTRMSPVGVTPTAIAAQDANIVYIGDASANIYKSTNSAWTWGTAVAGKAGAVTRIIVPRYDDVIIGGTGKISYSTDGAATFTSQDAGLGGGAVYVAADTMYAGNKTVYAGTTTTPAVYRWVIGTSTTFEDLLEPTGVAVTGLATANKSLYSLSAADVDRSVNPTALTGSISWGTMDASTTPGPAFIAAFGGTTSNTVYTASGPQAAFAAITCAPKIAAYADFLAVTAPTIASPADKYNDSVDPVSGRGDAVTIALKPLGTDTGLVNTIDIEIREKSTGLQALPTCAAQVVPGDNPTIIMRSATNGAGDFFKANTEYIWSVRANNTVSNDGVPGVWSAPRTFTVQSGGAVVQEHAGPIVQSPQPGATNVDPKLVGITWAPVAGATEYTVIVATDAALTKTVATTPAKVTAPAFQATGLDNSTTYFYSIQATKPTVGLQAIGSFTTAAKPAPTVAPTTPAPLPTPQIVFPQQATPAYVWAIIVIGGVLILAVIILIVRTRRVP